MSKNSGEGNVDKVVLNYMQTQNRPFSVNDVCCNLKDAFGKTGVQKALDKLVDDGRIIEKTYGKQKIYLVNQSGFKEISQAESQGLDAKIQELEKSFKSLESEGKEAQNKLNSLQNTRTTEELRQELKEITKEVAELESKHISLSTKTIVVDKEKRKLQKKIRDQHMAEWRSRKRKCLDMLDAVLENYPSTKKALFEEIGVETDEDANVSFPSN